MEETIKEEVKKDEFKQVKKKSGKHAKLTPASTVLLTLAATLGIIVLGAIVYSIFKFI